MSDQIVVTQTYDVLERTSVSDVINNIGWYVDKYYTFDEETQAPSLIGDDLIRIINAKFDKRCNAKYAPITILTAPNLDIIEGLKEYTPTDVRKLPPNCS
jgi:hypothetical protein